MKKNLFMLLMLIGCMSANAQQGYWAGVDYVELTPDESVVYRYVQAMDEESEKTLNNLYAGMEETGDKSILKRNADMEWYVKNDYPLPEGNYYESRIYQTSDKTIYGDLIIRPAIKVYFLEEGFQMDGLLEYLGDKVKVDIYENRENAYIRYVLACQVRTSDEVLEIIKAMHDFGLGDVSDLYKPLLWSLDFSETSKLTGIDGSGFGLIAEIDWTMKEYYDGCFNPIYSVIGVGLILNSTPADGANYWEPQYPMIASIPELKKGGHYLAKFTIDAPAAGEIRLDLCSWDGSGAYYPLIINVEAGEKEYTVDFPDYPTTCTDAMIFYQCGHLPGQHIIKKVQVFKIADASGRGDETAIHAVKTENADDAVFNLFGQKINGSYKGVAIKNGKKFFKK